LYYFIYDVAYAYHIIVSLTSDSDNSTSSSKPTPVFSDSSDDYDDFKAPQKQSEMNAATRGALAPVNPRQQTRIVGTPWSNNSCPIDSLLESLWVVIGCDELCWKEFTQIVCNLTSTDTPFPALHSYLQGRRILSLTSQSQETTLVSAALRSSRDAFRQVLTDLRLIQPICDDGSYPFEDLLVSKNILGFKDGNNL
jgi:hypothetical protein